MPEVSLKTVADRGNGVLVNMHPRFTESGTEVILTPDDLTEGKGNFLNVDAEGNPEGFKLAKLPRVVSHEAFLGTVRDKTTKQVALPVHEPSYLVNGPIATGDDEPDDLLETSLPKPTPPTIKLRPASVAGYPASTDDHPYYLGITGFRGGRHTPLSPLVKLPPLEQGQCFRVTIPDNMPVGTTHIGWWLSQPGLSSPSQSGQMRLQKLTVVGAFVGEMEFTGPYVYSTVSAEGTQLSAPSTPRAEYFPQRFPMRIGTYSFRITAANELGETLPSSMSRFWSVPADAIYNDGDTQRAGKGRIEVTRGALPSGSTGWYLYCFVNNQWSRVFDKFTGEGLTKPLSLGTTSIITQGWEGSEPLAGGLYLLSSASLPVENTSGIEAPTNAAEITGVFGASRPAPGRYYAKQRDISENDDTSPLSDAVYEDVGENEVMEIIFSNPVNKLPNATFVSKGADGYPLGYSVSGSGVTLDDGVLVMDASQNPVIVTDTVFIDPKVEWSAGAFVNVSAPSTGAFSGSFEVVLREHNSSGTQTDTVLQSISSLGDTEYHATVSAAGSGSLSWQDDTDKVQIVYRFPTSSNMTVRISRQHLNDYVYSFRRRESSIAGGPANSNPSPEATANPAGDISVEPSPTPPTSTETTSQVAPDRPLSEGVVLDTLSFASVPTAPWATSVSGATLTASGGKLVAQKTSGASAGVAQINRTFTPDVGLSERNSLGPALDGVTFNTLPVNGAVTFAELRDDAGTRFGWLDVDTRAEEARLRIDSSPTGSGNITTTLDENGTATTRTTAVVATKEKSTLNIMNGPTADGALAITLNGKIANIPVTVGSSGYPEIVSVEITRGASAMGQIAVALHGPLPGGTIISFAFAVVLTGDSPETIAARLRAYANDPRWREEPWLISGSGRFVTFTAKHSAPTYGGHTFFSNTRSGSGLGETGVKATVRVAQSGKEQAPLDTPASIAARAGSYTFEDYTQEQSGTSVNFEALEPGAHQDATVDAGSTGVVATMATTQQGARDTAEEVAQKIAATYSGNAYQSAVNVSSTVVFSALSGGAKQDGTVSFGTTGVTGEMQTTIQGSSDIVAHAKDAKGFERQRQIFTNVTNSTSYNLSFSRTGKESAVIQIFGSTGTDTKELKGLFEDIDLPSGGTLAVGATAESSPSLTWEVRIDELKVTDRGESYYRYHDYQGNLLNQIYFSHPPNLLPSEGFGLAGFKMAVLPDTQYTASIFARWAGFREACEPLYLYCVTPDDEIRPLRDLSGFGGISGTKGWHETDPYTFTTPLDCYELRLDSKTISGGELVIQEFCVSEGDTVKRTSAYAADGSYVATLNLATPYMRNPGFWSRERRELATDIYIPDTCFVETTYRARDAGGAYGDPVSDPATLEQKNEIRIDVSASSDGTDTPVIRSQSPRAEYVLKSGSKPLATLVKADRTELDGGAIFQNLTSFAEKPEVNFQVLPGKRFVRIPTYPPVGNQPGYELQVFTLEAKKYLEDRLGLVDVVIEAWDMAWTIRHGPGSENIVFEHKIPEYKKDGRWYGWYVAKFPEAQVIDVRDLP